MPLGPHRMRHLNRILHRVNRVRNMSNPRKARWAAAKDIPIQKLPLYLTRLETKVNLIISTETWPEVTDEAGRARVAPYEIHDFLEKRDQTLRV